MDYRPLESGNLTSLGITSPSFTGAAPSFLATSTFVYALLFSAIVAAAFYRYALAGIYRMEASESGIRKSNETFKRVTLGLLGVFSLFLILFTVNKDLVTGNVGLSEFGRAQGSGGGLSTGNTIQSGQGGVYGGGGATGGYPATTQPGSGNTSRSCESTQATISRLQSSGGICGGVSCTVLSGCNYQQYASIINTEARAVGVDPRMIIVTMCKESRAISTAQGQNPNGSFDCGLMQINQAGVCDATILNPTENIRRGVALMRQKINASNQVYQNIPAEAGAFSSYNCCANGTVPNSPSADCTTASGFPYAIPKWACPINPGEGTYNMCVVKNYACELSACMRQLQ